MNRILLTLLFGCVILPAEAQLYYQDIYTAKQTMKDHALYVANKVSRLTLKSFDAGLQTNNDFVCEKTFRDNYRRMDALTRSNQTGSSQLTSWFNDQGQLLKSVDSSSVSVNTSIYEYDAGGRISSILFSSTSGEKIGQFAYSEVHHFEYDAGGRLKAMTRTKGRLEYSVVSFRTDEKGNVVEENERAKDFSKTVFYKYDDEGRLTDVYHYNPAKKRMVPDYMFDYDSSNRVSEMTTVLSDAAGYNVWKYFYDEKGLLSREECYDRGKTPLGMIRFTYEFK